MDDDALIVVFTVSGAALGSLFAFVIPGATPELIVTSATVYGGLGALVGGGSVALSKSRRKRDNARSTRRPAVHKPVQQNRRAAAHPNVPTPQPFRKRLAKFTDQDESEVMTETDSFKSRMPFWSAVDFLIHVPPKSAQVIRACLVAIRRAVRGNGNT
ncbi:hypothetical protein FHS27_006608 [Rhodopirellula rubra]|uniref:Uncharacterized protein n=1 Tax=Aporhodopirellula rubra TaxID=980271 RepID=A0A7W5HA54_9BACT|nr:hypothetical protein [Aporhodopirellula rubra]